jgi:low affinity Fe/Cu permease
MFIETLLENLVLTDTSDLDARLEYLGTMSTSSREKP